jgi:hypothetical protein
LASRVDTGAYHIVDDGPGHIAGADKSNDHFMISTTNSLINFWPHRPAIRRGRTFSRKEKDSHLGIYYNTFSAAKQEKEAEFSIFIQFFKKKEKVLCKPIWIMSTT